MKKGVLRKALTYILMLCMISSVWSMDIKTVHAEEPVTMYFLNSQGWSQVGTYIYGDKGELLGAWPGADAEAADELGPDWVKTQIPDSPSFNIIFFNKENDAERAELLIPDASHTYVSAVGKSYTSAEEAEVALKETPTVIYFVADKDWEEVYVYADKDGADIGAGWPGIKAEPAEAGMGDGWWKAEVPQNALLDPFDAVCHNNNGWQTEAVTLTNYQDNYITQNGELFTVKGDAEASVGIANETVVYFLNSKDWEQVGAYVYGVGEPLGPWPGKNPEPAEEMGDKWMQMAVPALPAFNVIFFNKDAQEERAELQIPNKDTIYVTGSNEVYGSKEAAELSEGLGDASKLTEVFFYNNRGWGDINGYVYVEDGDSASTLGAGWPGKAATPATELGDNWWSFLVPREATADTAFKIIFNDGVNQTGDILIADKENVYASASGGPYAGAEETEQAAANDSYDDGCEDGPNADLKNYKVKSGKAGAVLPYTTYEAEAADTNAQVLLKSTTYSESVQSEASGRMAVELVNKGDYVEFTLDEPADAMVLRYSIPDSEDGTGTDATLSMYINGVETQDLSLTSRYAWVYGTYPYTNTPSEGNPHRFFDETRVILGEKLSKGTTIRLQKDEGDDAKNYIIDFIECEVIDEVLTQPANSLSVTDYGAVADDGADDRAAFEACIEAAKAEGKEVWIPAGTFNLEEKLVFTIEGITIRGAGMWHTNLVGAGAAFKYQGTSKFYDFAVTGVSTVRDDSGDLAGFEGNGSRATNVTIQNIWMEHIKVGVWSCNTENLVIQGCRIRNTYADGINLCSGTHNATVRNNNIRNTGDDCIAIWPWLAECTGNTISHNTIQAPMLANGVAIYGGADNTAEYNHISEIINNGSGICVGSEFETKAGYTGTINVRNNLLVRCGSMQTDKGYPIGALWIWSSWNPMTTAYNLTGNTLKDCSYEGILVDCNSEVAGLTIRHIDVDGATDAIYVRGQGTGEATIGNINAKNCTGEIVNNGDSNFIITYKDEAALSVVGIIAIVLILLLAAAGVAGTLIYKKKNAK